MRKQNNNFKKQLILLIETALFTAMVTVATAYIPHVPIPATGGYIHLGDCFIYLAACFLPTPYAIFAGAAGAGIADAILAPIYIIPTIIIKSFLVLPFTSKNNKIITKRNILATLACVVITSLGYYIAEFIMFENKIAPLVSMVPSLIQSGGSGLLFAIIGISLDKTNIKSRITKLI